MTELDTESFRVPIIVAVDAQASAEAAYDLSVTLHKLGAVAMKAGDLQSARARFQEDLRLARKLARDNPTSTAAQRDLLVSLFRLGQVSRDPKLLREALAIARGLEGTGRLAPADRELLEQILEALESMT